MNSNEIEGTARDLKGHAKDAVGGLTGDGKTQAEGKVDKAAGHLLNQYGETVETAKQAASDAGDAASDYAGRARAALHDAAGTVRHQAGEVGSRIYDASTQAGRYVEETVKEQPLLSLIGVAALGYLLGFLIHSSASPFAPEPPPQPLRRLGWR